MKLKLSKKTKTFLSVATAIIASTAVTTLLTSCSSAKESDIIDTGGYDKEYGINDVTYARMEEDFKTLYKSQLDEKKSSGEIDDSTYNLNLSTFQSNLNSIHASLYSDENKTLSYTIRTNVLRDYARNNYGIRLSRQSNVSLSVTISGIKNSIVDSVLLLCKEYKITDTKKYRENAETEFDKFYKEAIAEYGEDDVVSIVQYVQTRMVDCFKGICKELDCLAAQQQLKDFINKYQINVKENLDKNYYWDKLFSKYGKGGKEISVEDFNSIFTMTYEETDPQSSSSSYFSTTKKTKEFRNDLITGYTLKPILVKMNPNPSTNVYSIDVDYTLVNNNYKDDEKVAELTAHSSQLKDKSFYEDENISIFDLNKSSEEREYTNYELPITIEYEKEQINKTYFNNNDFKFTWSTSEEYGYDDFWTEPNENGEYKGKLNVSGLATSGMMINGVLLTDILNQAGKISLSGGSRQLNGIVKKADKDARQWKLTVDGNEIKNEDISWQLVSATTVDLPGSIKINDGVVSWTDKIETGTYSFYVLANYKATKIQTALITLNISSEQSENTGNLNYAIKDALYDENTISQELLDFVKYVNFSLDYTEKDYDTDKDGKKGEILVNNIIIGYKNSKNTFTVSNSDTKKAISNAINNDSGVTARFSNNLYENVRNDFCAVITAPALYGKFAESYISSTSNDLNHKWIIMLIISSSLTIIGAVLLAILIFYACSKTKTSSLSGCKKYVSWGFIVVSFVALLTGTILSICKVFGNINNSLDKLKMFKDWDKQADDSDEFYSKLCDDTKYFLPADDSEKAIEKCKKEFNNLSVSDAKAKKSFYEQCLIKPTDYEENPDKYKDTPYGQYQKSFKHLEEVLNDMEDINFAFYAVIIGELVTFAILIVSFIYIFKSFKNANNQMPPQIPQAPDQQHEQAGMQDQEKIIEKEIEEIEEIKSENEENEEIMEISENDQIRLHDLFVNQHADRTVNENAFNDALSNGNLLMEKATFPDFHKKDYKVLTNFCINNDNEKYWCTLYSKTSYDYYRELFSAK